MFRTLCAAVLALGSAAASRADDTADFLAKDNWEGLEKYWKFDGKTIVGKTEEDPKFNTFFCSKKQYTDFELAFEVKLTGKRDNSGVQVRSEVIDKEKFVVRGPQCDMGAQYWGGLYAEKMKEGIVKMPDPKLVKELLKKDEFNDYSIKLVGKHLVVKFNGTTTVDGDYAFFPETGIIAWQIHAGATMEVTFKNIKFTNLKK